MIAGFYNLKIKKIKKLTGSFAEVDSSLKESSSLGTLSSLVIETSSTSLGTLFPLLGGASGPFEFTDFKSSCSIGALSLLSMFGELSFVALLPRFCGSGGSKEGNLVGARSSALARSCSRTSSRIISSRRLGSLK